MVVMLATISSYSREKSETVVNHTYLVASRVQAFSSRNLKFHPPSMWPIILFHASRRQQQLKLLTDY